MGKVYIAGAGPGDPELLTCKARRVLGEADVVLYDRLVSSEILQCANPKALLIYVGKECGGHSLPQEKINELLVYYAEKYEVVVRLKGGDPFLFGRGGEEALALAERGLPFEIIPGVTSALAVPAYAGIPVTHRGLTSHCTIITGHLSHKSPESIPWDKLNHKGTLIFLMGVKRRQLIAQKLIQGGRSPSEPVAFIHRGTTPQQQIIFSTLGEVAQSPPEVKPPAIFIIGPVVELGYQLQWFFPQLLRELPPPPSNPPGRGEEQLELELSQNCDKSFDMYQ